MKTKIFILLFLLTAGIAISCDNDVESLKIQKPYTYSDLYYQNLRDYKASDHSIAFGWFADYTQHHSLAIRFMGLPDSLDICSLWGGIPTLSTKDTLAFCDTVAYNEMWYVRKVKGTKMVVPTIIRIANFPQFSKDSVGVNAFGDYLVNMVLDHNLDGADLDYEPEGDWLTGEPMSWLIKHMAEKLGPKSCNPNTLLIIDYYSETPPSDTEPYVNYYVRQAYGSNASQGMIPSWCPNEKYVFTENIGDNWQTGGTMLQQAAWQPATGRKGGFGAFYMHRDYNLNPPYKTMREGIQLQNPAIH
jgi:hypothetical protein